jgi:seryl-tRNA synthetase
MSPYCADRSWRSSVAQRAWGDFAVRLEIARKQTEKHNRRLRDLQNEQQKLLQLFYRDGVDEEVLQAEQKRIETERTQARRWITSATHETEEAETALDEALAIIPKLPRDLSRGLPPAPQGPETAKTPFLQGALVPTLLKWCG